MKNFITHLDEASYMGNIGFVEMCKFWKEASKDEENKMNRIIKNEDWEEFKNLIFSVINVKLK